MRFAADDIGPADGVVYFANAHAIGVRTPDALYRFMRGFGKPVIAAHHLFAADPARSRPSPPGLGSLAQPDARLTSTYPPTGGPMMTPFAPPTARPSRTPGPARGRR